MALQRKDLQIWQKKLTQFGLEYAELENMLQQGFLENCETELRTIQEGLATLIELQNEAQDFDLVFSKFIQVEALLKKVRMMHVNRLRRERLILRAQKEKLLQKKKLKAIQDGKKHFSGKTFSNAFKLDESNAVQLSQSELPVVLDMEDLAEQMQLGSKQIAGLIYNHTGGNANYSHFKASANNEQGFRWIVRPKPVLKKAQDWILAKILSRIPVHPSAMAFRTGKSVLDVMELHVDHALIIRLDLSDFYHSIKFQTIKGFFQTAGYSGELASALALMLTHNPINSNQATHLTQHARINQRSIPQNISTSKAMTNIICFRMDSLMQRLAEQFGLTYSRYEARLILSHPDAEIDIKSVLNLAIQIIKEEGFDLQTEKTAVIRLKSEQPATSEKRVTEAPSTSERTPSRHKKYQNRLDDESFDKVEEVDETRKVQHFFDENYIVKAREF